MEKRLYKVSFYIVHETDYDFPASYEMLRNRILKICKIRSFVPLVTDRIIMVGLDIDMLVKEKEIEEDARRLGMHPTELGYLKSVLRQMRETPN